MKIAMIAERSTDFSNVLLLSGVDVTLIRQADMIRTDFSQFDSVMFCGGTDREGKAMCFDNAQWNVVLDLCIRGRQRLFVEYAQTFGTVKAEGGLSTRYERPVVAQDALIPGLGAGDILNEQSNVKVAPYLGIQDAKVLLHYYKNPKGFYKMRDAGKNEPVSPALFFLGERILFSAFRLSDFARARFSPRKKWFCLMDYISRWLCGTGIEPQLLDRYYGENAYYTLPCGEGTFEDQANRCVDRVFAWLENAGMLYEKDGKPYAVHEGLVSDVFSDGTQPVGPLRNDSTGETAFLYFMKYLQTGEERCRAISESLTGFTRELITAYDNELDGYGCWNTPHDYTVCYQDDTARGFLLPGLLRMLYSGDRSEEQTIRRSLDFLLRTTSPNGLRTSRTDIVSFDPPLLTARGYRGTVSPRQIRTTPCAGLESVHHNGAYMAALLLAYKLFGDERCKQTALKGMESIMAVYPNTVREHSETQEYCRLILPLAFLYWVTGEEKHRQWLYRVTEDLEKFKCAGGGYLEWDTGYSANCAGVANGESSVLDENGNPVVDMLYSVNWLPAAFAQAYFVTRDEKFYRLWKEVCSFIISIQIHSSNKMIDGVWARAYDIDLNEVYGVPNDVGWAPWSVECGWTMGEVPIGILMGLMKDRLSGYYR